MERRKTRRLAPPPKLRGADSSVQKDLSSHKRLLVLTNFVDPEIEAEIARIQNKPTRTVADIVLLCLLRFRQIRAVMLRIPKTTEAWMNVQLQMIKRHMGPLKYLSDKDIKKIITHVRQINANRHPEVTYTEDPDLPSCYYWNVDQVCQWLFSIGYSHLREMFRNNGISGRKLITVDASALSRMGLRYFKDITDLAARIRSILKIRPPNMMRALMCKIPFEQYLRQRQWSGESYDDMTFQKFCDENGYPYHLLRKDPLAIIECARELSDYMGAFAEVKHGVAAAAGSDSDHKLGQVPTVEFTVRHILIRDKVLSELIDTLLELGLSPHGPERIRALSSLGHIFNQGYEDLGLTPEEYSERLAFGRHVAEEMLNEALRTARVLEDLAAFKAFLHDQNVSEETVSQMRDVASEFFGSAANVASLLALGQLDLEAIFKQEPEFSAFVDGIVGEAEEKLSEVVPEAFIDQVIRAADAGVKEMAFPNLDESTVGRVRSCARALLGDMSHDRVLNVEEVKRRRLNDEEVSSPRGTNQNAAYRPARIAGAARNSLIDDSRASGGDANSPRLLLMERLSDSSTKIAAPEPNAVSQQLDPELVSLVLDHVVYDVVQEALTQVLDSTASATETQQLMITLEGLKNVERLVDARHFYS